MADNLTPFDASDPSGAISPQLQGSARASAGSKSSKLLIGALVVIAVLVVIGLIVGVFVLGGTSDTGSDVAGSQLTNASVTAASTTASTAKDPADVNLDDIFTFRDIFVPTIVLVSTQPTSQSTENTTSNTTNAPANTLVLEDITTENGEPVAVLSWNGQTYSLHEGEGISGTPWEVLEINESSVVMLYGDQRITLSVGVGISK